MAGDLRYVRARSRISRGLSLGSVEVINVQARHQTRRSSKRRAPGFGRLLRVRSPPLRDRVQDVEQGVKTGYWLVYHAQEVEHYS